MLLAAGLLLSSFVFGATPSGFDYNAWKRVYDRHISHGALMGVPTSIVDYGKINKDPDFQTTIDSLAKANVWDLSVNESLALGCNAYNIFAIKTVTENPCKRGPKGECLGPIYGLNNLPQGFTSVEFNFGGKNYSLNGIESQFHPNPHPPLFKAGSKEDLRAHACLVCTGISCPDVLFYHPDHVQEQLNFAATNWMANPYKGMRIDKTTNTVYWNDILNWYHDEFVKQGGIEVAYSKFLSPSAKEFFTANSDYKTEYLGYVWDSNGPINCDCLPDVTNLEAVAPTRLQKQLGFPTPFCHVNEPNATARA